MLVMVIGPYGKRRGATPPELEANVRRACEVGAVLARMGVIPIIPLLWHYVDAQMGGDNEHLWEEASMELLKVCDAVVKLPSPPESFAQKEHAQALALGLPVYELGAHPDCEAELGRWLYPAPEAVTVGTAGDSGAGGSSASGSSCGAGGTSSFGTKLLAYGGGGGRGTGFQCPRSKTNPSPYFGGFCPYSEGKFCQEKAGCSECALYLERGRE